MWTHLARQAGGRAGGASGGVGVRGPGETQLEVDRREINHRITHLKKELEKVRAHRARYRSKRRQAGIPVVAIVGYTNAGKSTLLNTLTNANVLAADQLFATLDPTTRSDTVGFIQKLPTTLVAAFRATLEEINEADLIVHVVDITHPNAAEQAQTVAETLFELGVTEIPILAALNKIDLLPDPQEATEVLARFANSLAISALTGRGLPQLLARIGEILQSTRHAMRLLIPYARGDLVSILHEQAIVDQEQHQAEGTYLEVHVPKNLTRLVKPFRLKPSRS
jgi:GTP-binding protein HflX